VSTLRTPPTDPAATPGPAATPAPTPSPAEPALIARGRQALRDVLRLVAERADAEAKVEAARSAAAASADRDQGEKRRALDEKYRSLVENARTTDEARRRTIVDAATQGEATAKAEFAKASRRLAAEFDAAREQARTGHQKARSRATADFEKGEKEAATLFVGARKAPDEVARIVASMRARLAAILADYRHFGLTEAPAVPARGAYKPDDPLDKAFDRLGKQEPELDLLEGLLIPKSMKGRRFLWPFALLFLAAVLPMIALQGPEVGVPVAAAVAIGGGFFLKSRLYALSKSQVGKLYYPISQVLVDADALAAGRLAAAEERHHAERLRLVEARDEATLRAKHEQARAIAAAEADRDERLRRINEVYAGRKVETQTKMALEMREAVDAHEKRKAELPALYEAGTRKLDEKSADLRGRISSGHDAAWRDLADRWHRGMAAARAGLDAVAREVDAIGPAWDDPSWADRAFPAAVPPALRFGTARLDLGRLPGGISADPRLNEGVDPGWAFPALVPFPDRANLVVEAPTAGRAAAPGRLQGAMFRLLAGLPPGQVRFTIVDPVGIGRGFGAFMHLADFDESLVSGQVWTDPRQVEERLAELSAHMEKVTQKYLRDEYASIDEYNAVAGEVAEPYRVLVVADFPAGFDERSAARLASIAAAGVPCGVLTLIARDLDRPLPAGVDADDLRANALALAWDDAAGLLTWDDPDFGRLPLEIEPPPAGEAASRLIRRVGAAARDAKRVEVPFEFIAPPEGAYWTKDSRAGIEVALGKAGATRRQDLALGKGTAQHVLVAGRTGSGKSTLLHALIVNIALNYGPDEVELYLIDFKKGVEFKVYATYGLPHAAVIAIESEREFGISVLQRLDAEMRSRADRFRDAGVQDVNGYRNAPGTPPLPRILLIVDEFQEFFVEEDKLAGEAALLLDRLVRQGRAFGVHVHLGSQSLGGAYALARTTLGQFAIRIALQCSDADAHLILGEHNDAARLLSRPGEAIYNDQNGLAEGNHFFQVVWLPDARREFYLKALRDLARDRPPASTRAPIVFEGDARADLARNDRLRPLLEAGEWPRSPRSATAWLGDPVAIKDPTAAVFRRQGGNHLLVVGQNAEGALGIMASALIGLAAQYPPPRSETARHGARFYLLDGTPEDDPNADALARSAAALPHPVALGAGRDAPRIVAEVAEEVARRQRPDADDGPEVFLLIHDLGRFRDLRRREDDFGFGKPAEDASPADHLALILREGAPLGVHVLAWADNLASLNRAFDNQALREFESRVLFQMSSNDSAHLLDAPHASKLGPNRAYFSGEEQNRLEKFRPYGLPPAEWLDRVREAFRARPGSSAD